jgi:hypothetical protein
MLRPLALALALALARVPALHAQLKAQEQECGNWQAEQRF